MMDQASADMTRECIDVYSHALPKRFCSAAGECAAKLPFMFQRAQQMPVMVDLDTRLRVLEQFPDYRQIISLPGPPVEVLAPNAAVKLAAIANDEQAQLVDEAGGRFCGFAAALPMNNVEAAVVEAKRAKRDLRAVAVQLYSSVNGHPLDERQFEPIFDALHELQLPVLLHPIRTSKTPDYPCEKLSKYDLWWAIGWPYETTLAMVRLALSGMFQRLPGLTVVAHHVGGFLPLLAGRLGPGMELFGTRAPPGSEASTRPALEGDLLDACCQFYADTASFGSRAAIECGLEFFGVEHLLFASDMPFDPGQGPDYIRSTLAAVDEMNLTDEQRNDILLHNARRLFHIDH